MIINNYRQIFIMVLAAILSVSFAGPNQNARVSLDYDFRTPAVETATSDDTCFIGVYLEGAIDINSYSVKLHFDSSATEFLGANLKKSFMEKPFIESTGGHALPLMHQIGNSAELAVTLTGNGTSVSGNGYIGYFIFNQTVKGTSAVTIEELKLVNREKEIDILP